MSDDNDRISGVDTDSGMLEPDESLDYRGIDDVLDEGYSPPERPWAVSDWGLTAREASGHESLDGRLARELPDSGAFDDGDGIGDAADTDGEAYDEEVGVDRAGRLASDPDPDEDYPYLYANDVGIDGSAATAEEAAVHIIPENSYEE
ncbi:DUF5709 domain-containing protein [Saccharopolyspora sp. K220]|uniref:DUF5709 domain-containing protein n=1 Tax=Saccharopolyspora soli TaxID=2926618 RepID=UPI001F563BD7|nr:DUF5709 domain-containing protein [Saccharopolyspora soli]MCI2423188.1 DUF5709 domain-containing protein [Saccharopolyspora soli]